MTFETFDEYQDATRVTAIYPGAGSGNMAALSYAALGLSGEAGEVANKVKKVLRDDGGTLTPEKAAAILDEVGDVLWYAARVSEEVYSTLGAAAKANIVKLFDRKERGTLAGSGDTR